ncbi:von Willebrand factor type A (vWA) domain-containing protein (BatA domain), putative oxygen tolerance protein BatA [Campylobacter blaseri]|uniref:VWFA domain-containing protein n=1 Tax=Campylobacter blaseri TaxID=2042961 RepID=A0A2P8R066_9BACT|nr:VWA domain-containing protein [Campylobacter blaseri]PSM51896.1 hypothetical protein CQ405_04845 [Campylobacter blaseri]PSM53680.1 hypothetical protein CRN67_04845 [Campylobacter blaseri]QKF85767.1 von Willebrand factor type A (vWA) domain-containing protein (BatA domain), putative oxygen tolerance protein BatA [Campylobacter blaseri]
MSILNPYYLILLIIPFLLIFFIAKKRDFNSYFSKDVLKEIQIKKYGFSKKTRSYCLIAALIFAILALSRPYIDNGKIKIKSEQVDVAIGLDVSQSMSVDDIYPNRLEFSKRKIFAFMENAFDKDVSLIGFSSRAFLVSPLTNDFNSLKYLVENLKFSHLNLKGTSIMSLLEATNTMFKDEKNKILIIFTDGGDNEDFSKEIRYAKSNNIAVFVYLTATEKGSLFKADNGDVVLLKANENIRNLALETGGAFVRFSLSNEDMKELNSLTSAKFKNQEEKEKTIYNRQELFYYPLILAIIFFIMANFSLMDRRKI